MVVGRGKGGRGSRGLFCEYTFSIREVESVLEIDGGDGCTIM